MNYNVQNVFILSISCQIYNYFSEFVCYVNGCIMSAAPLFTNKPKVWWHSHKKKLLKCWDFRQMKDELQSMSAASAKFKILRITSSVTWRKSILGPVICLLVSKSKVWWHCPKKKLIWNLRQVQTNSKICLQHFKVKFVYFCEFICYVN